MSETHRRHPTPAFVLVSLFACRSPPASADAATPASSATVIQQPVVAVAPPEARPTPPGLLCLAENLDGRVDGDALVVDAERFAWDGTIAGRRRAQNVSLRRTSRTCSRSSSRGSRSRASPRSSIRSCRSSVRTCSSSAGPSRRARSPGRTARARMRGESRSTSIRARATTGGTCLVRRSGNIGYHPSSSKRSRARAGRWFHYDTMHFEYRPELLDIRCRTAPQDR